MYLYFRNKTEHEFFNTVSFSKMKQSLCNNRNL